MLGTVQTTSVRIGLVAGCATLSLSALACQGDSDTQASTPTREPAGTCAEETLVRFAPTIDWHAAHYPALQAQDLYKLLHQAVAGPAHAIDDREMARQWLAREWQDLGEPLAGEERLEPLSVDGRLVRLNLRPWRAAGKDPDAVLDAFVRTAGAMPPDTARIRSELDAVAACADRLSERLPLTGDSIRNFFTARAAEGYPAVHHSEAHTAAYRPAYRVVLREYLD